MCGRFSQTQSGKVIAEAFQLKVTPTLTTRYNIAPTQSVSVITQCRRTQARELHEKRWGLIPQWAKDTSIGQRLINARSETVATKPSFRNAFQRRRCLVVADGFYEWQKPSQERAISQTQNLQNLSMPSSQKNPKQPFFIQLKTKAPFAFAGLWERWQDPSTHQTLFSCAILTTRPNELMASIHHRMPVILAPKDYDIWLDPTFYNPGKLETLLHPYDAAAMLAIPISDAINNPNNDSDVVQERLEIRSR